MEHNWFFEMKTWVEFESRSIKLIVLKKGRILLHRLRGHKQRLHNQRRIRPVPQLVQVPGIRLTLTKDLIFVGGDRTR
jgi:hypothetical protein